MTSCTRGVVPKDVRKVDFPWKTCQKSDVGFLSFTCPGKDPSIIFLSIITPSHNGDSIFNQNLLGLVQNFAYRQTTNMDPR